MHATILYSLMSCLISVRVKMLDAKKYVRVTPYWMASSFWEGNRSGTRKFWENKSCIYIWNDACFCYSKRSRQQFLVCRSYIADHLWAYDL